MLRVTEVLVVVEEWLSHPVKVSLESEVSRPVLKASFRALQEPLVLVGASRRIDCSLEANLGENIVCQHPRRADRKSTGRVAQGLLR